MTDKDRRDVAAMSFRRCPKEHNNTIRDYSFPEAELHNLYKEFIQVS